MVPDPVVIAMSSLSKHTWDLDDFGRESLVKIWLEYAAILVLAMIVAMIVLMLLGPTLGR